MSDPRTVPATVAMLLAVAALACSREQDTPRAETAPPPPEATLRAVEPPSGPGAMAPNLALRSGAVLLTWLEPTDPESRRAFRLRAASWDGDAWSAAGDVASGEAFFANWADVPGAVAGREGSLLAHWLEKLGEDTYAYGVGGGGSRAGAAWERLGWLHDDASPVEHGFVSYVPTAGGVQAFWLDGRAMAATPPGAMQLRTTLVTGGEPGASTVLDDRVCECCQTDAAATAEGPIVVYRDRGKTEIRDVSVIRAEGGGWSAPEALFEDGWEIHGCPVNGPAVAAGGDRVAVAWFTAPGGEPRVSVAFSADSGRTFAAPVTVDAARPIGRADVALDPAGRAWVSWMSAVGEEGERGELRLQSFAPAGEASRAEIVAETTTARSAGVPRMTLAGDRLVLVWVEDAEPSRLAMAVRPVG